jgi:protein TonB
VAPTEIPTDIPPINLEEKFDPRDYSGSGVEGGSGTGMVPGDQVYAEALVEEKPEMLSGPYPDYPQMLKNAGIEGTVVVQVVIDTMGRAEPNSIKIIRTPNAGFDTPTKNAVRQALFRPARVHGRAVRVLVQIPFNFKLTRQF